MSGLIALLDDIAALARMAAAQVDDIAATSLKIGGKTAGILIDDAAVTPKYVTGLSPARELPIIAKIAVGSLRNKLMFLLPILLLLQAFLPGLITPLLMCGGAYLCFEGAEKILHALSPHGDDHAALQQVETDPVKLEAQRVNGAIRTDLILSAEIMTIALSYVETDSVLDSAIILAVVGIMITVLVYGAVAILVKMDDIGAHLTLTRLGVLRNLGSGIVHAMPHVFTLLSVIGTAAMLWVGGNILVHGLDVMGWSGPYAMIHGWAQSAAAAVPAAAGFVAWLVTAAADGVIGLGVGLIIAAIVVMVIKPMLRKA